MTDKTLLSTMKPEKLLELLNESLEYGREEAKVPEAHWYPCGFAWLSISIRKNHRLSKTLQSFGFRWDDYRKAYITSLYNHIPSVSGMEQSMDYRARVLNAVAVYLRESGLSCYVETRVD